MTQRTSRQDLLGKWAIVTGASSGLGTDFAEILAERGCSLILVARRQSRLGELQSKLASPTVQVHPLQLDLSQREAPRDLYEYVREHRITVDYVINNAGFGKVAPFADTTWEHDESMLAVNVRAVHYLTKLFLRDMLQRGSGAILNVASAAGFRPMANFAAYAATKAYVLHLSEALSVEVEGTGVTVSALCPGMTRTEFFDTSSANISKLAESTMADSRTVAQEGIDLMLRGGAVRVTGLLNRLMIYLGLFLPRRVVARMARSVLRKSHGDVS